MAARSASGVREKSDISMQVKERAKPAPPRTENSAPAAIRNAGQFLPPAPPVRAATSLSSGGLDVDKAQRAAPAKANGSSRHGKSKDEDEMQAMLKRLEGVDGRAPVKYVLTCSQADYEEMERNGS